MVAVVVNLERDVDRAGQRDILNQQWAHEMILEAIRPRSSLRRQGWLHLSIFPSLG